MFSNKSFVKEVDVLPIFVRNKMEKELEHRTAFCMLPGKGTSRGRAVKGGGPQA